MRPSPHLPLDARRDTTPLRNVEGGRLVTLLKEYSSWMYGTFWSGLCLVLVSSIVEEKSKMDGGWRP
jgi:hypothetical protein